MIYSQGSLFHPNYTDKPKDKAYYIGWGNYIMYRAQTFEITISRQQNWFNNNFLHGDSVNNLQWMFSDDTDFFLNDESGNPRMRTMQTANIIMPIVRMIKNMAISSDYEFELKPMSDMTKRRYDRELARVKAMGIVANNVGGVLGDHIKSNYPIGETDADTEREFKSYYSDDLVNGINCLCRAVADMNQLNGEVKKWLANQLIVFGIGVLYDTVHNGYQSFERIDASRFIWDVSAQQPDLQDGNYMGDYWLDLPSNIYEAYPELTEDQRAQINMASQITNNGTQWYNRAWLGNTTGRVRVMRAYFRDNEWREEGVVMNEYGDELFTRINHPESRFTDEDLIEPKNPVFIKVLEGKKKRKSLKEIIHFVKFVDCTMDVTPTDPDQGNLPIILEYGEMPYSENNPFLFGRTQFPYKCNTFSYFNGYPQGIVGFIVGEQRLYNKVLSVKEQQINQYQPPVTLYDKTVIDAQAGGETKFRINLQNGIPTSVIQRGGLPNQVMRLPGTDLASTMQLDAVNGNINMAAQNSVGANPVMLGSDMNQLVRTNQMQIQQGSLMQEDIFSALSDILRQCYQSIATRGRKIYYDNPASLSYSLGSDLQREIMVSPETLNEQVLIQMKKSLPHGKDVEIANAKADAYLAAGVIDGETFGKVIGRSTIQELYSAVAQYQIRKAITDSQMAQKQDALMQEQMNRQDSIRQEGINMQRESTAGAQATAQEAINAKVFDSTVKSATEMKKAQLNPLNDKKKQLGSV